MKTKLNLLAFLLPLMHETAKTTTTQAQTQSGSGSFNQTTTPDANTPDIQKLRAQQFKIDDSIGYRVGGALRRMKDQISNPNGGYSTGQIRDAQQRSQERSLLESGSEAMRQGQQDVNQQDFARNATLAGMTQGSTSSGTSNQMGQMSGTGTGTQSSPLFGSIIGASAGVGAAAL